MDWLSLLPIEEIISGLLSAVQGGIMIADGNHVNDAIRVAPSINEHVLTLSDYLMDFGTKHAEKMTGVGRALGAVFAVIVAGKEAYKVMAEQKGFDVLDIMRPVLFAFVLAFWGPVVNIVSSPGRAIESHFRGIYEIANVRMDSLRQNRMELVVNMDNKIKEARAKQEQHEKAEESNKNIFSMAIEMFSDGFEAMQEYFLTKMKQIYLVIDLYIQGFVERIIIWIGELAFTVAIYIVFVIKALFITVLAMFGPIYMAASILPAWKDAWKQWVERMVHASLYGAMAYLAMAFSIQLICYSLEQDAAAIQKFIDNGWTIFSYATSMFGTCCTTAITYFVGCLAMKAVPEMATMAFPGHASHAAINFISGMGSKAYTVGKLGMK